MIISLVAVNNDSTLCGKTSSPVPERSAVTRVPGPVDLQPSVRSSTTRPCAAVSRDLSETPTLEAVRTPVRTVETIWPVSRMTAATGSVWRWSARTKETAAVTRSARSTDV